MTDIIKEARTIFKQNERLVLELDRICATLAVPGVAAAALATSSPRWLSGATVPDRRYWLALVALALLMLYAFGCWVRL